MQFLTDFPDKFQSGHFRHLDVSQNQIETSCSHLLQRFGSVGCLGDVLIADAAVSDAAGTGVTASFSSAVKRRFASAWQEEVLLMGSLPGTDYPAPIRREFLWGV